MEENMVITLETGDNYLLLLENAFTEGKYFLAVKLDEKETPTSDYIVFEEKDGGESTQVVTDVTILNKLLEDYQEQYEGME